MLVEAQTSDQHLGAIIEYLKTGQLPDDTQLARKIILQAGDFLLTNDILYNLHCKTDKGPSKERKVIQVSLPDTMVYQVLVEMHDGVLAAHPGIQATLQLVHSRYFGRKLTWTLLFNYVASCHKTSCNHYKHPPFRSTADWHRI